MSSPYAIRPDGTEVSWSQFYVHCCLTWVAHLAPGWLDEETLLTIQLIRDVSGGEAAELLASRMRDNAMDFAASGARIEAPYRVFLPAALEDDE